MNRAFFTIVAALVMITAGQGPLPAGGTAEPCIAFDLQVSRSGLVPAHREELKGRYYKKVMSLDRMRFLMGEGRDRVLEKYGIQLIGEINRRAAAGMIAGTPMKWYMTAGVSAEPGNMAGVYVLLDDSDPSTRWVSFQKTVTRANVTDIAAALERLLDKINDPRNDLPGR